MFKLFESFWCSWLASSAFPRGDGIFHRCLAAVVVWADAGFRKRILRMPRGPPRSGGEKKEMTMSLTDGSSALQQQNFHTGARAQRAYAPSPPVISRRRPAFSDTILEAGSRERTNRALRTGAALAAQVAIVIALLLVPLFLSQGIDLASFDKTLLVAPPPSAAPPPPTPHVAQTIPRRPVIHAQISTPMVIPRKIAVASPDAPAAPTVAGMTGGVPGGTGDVLGGSLTGPAPPPPAPVAEKPKGPIRISGGMKQPQLLYGPPAVYPQIAWQAHVSGTVLIEAIIDPRGDVVQVHAISGPPLLLQAAMKAVSERKYAPTILDGQPTAVQLEVRVNFHTT
jgi:periplasmic protein TonB